MAVNATAIWRVRPSGSNTNGGGYDPAISGAGTDYSQQNAAQATGVNGTASGTATFTDTTAANFTSAMVGNALWIASGAGFTVGAYFIVTFNSTTSVVLDRSPGTGTVAHWAVGGGWANISTNGATLVSGNTMFVLGSGTPNPASYSFDTSAESRVAMAGSDTAGFVTIANDPATPGYKASPDTTGGMPCIQLPNDTFFFGSGSTVLRVQGIWFVASGATNGSYGIFAQGQFATQGCVYDQLAFDFAYSGTSSSATLSAFGCEVFSSTAPGGSGTNFAINCNSFNLVGCNIHDTVGPGIEFAPSGANQLSSIVNTVIANCRGSGIKLISTNTNLMFQALNCTIDGNLGHGVEVNVSGALYQLLLASCIISNHTQVGKFGLTVTTGTLAVNNTLANFVDYNTFYNNTGNYNGISAGPHDTALGLTPYVASATENYTLA